MKKRIVLTSFTALALTAGSFAFAFSSKESNRVEEVESYSTTSLPTTINLNDCTSSEIKSYYSSLSSLATAQKQGTNLLKNLKTILKNGQKYLSYDSGNAIWQIYEISDRDWEKSPASSTTYGTYNAQNNTITGYTYGTGNSSGKNNPYIHALYVNRNVDNQVRAWGNHEQDQWGINREHVWPKAEGFETEAQGGARGDPMHLMAGNGYVNNIHSNFYYGYVDKTKSYSDCGNNKTWTNLSNNLLGKSKTVGGSTSVFEPQDCDKGDIARAIFYMVARYNYLSGSDSDGINSNNPNLTLTQSLSDWASSGYVSTTSNPGKMGIMTDLLNWHHQDPVDEFEIHRNNLLYRNYTNNRNPFIDYPEWVDYIWGTATYQGTTYQSYSSTPTGYVDLNNDVINGYRSGGSSETVSVTGVSLDTTSTSLSVGDDLQLNATVSPSNATDQSISWTSSDDSVATVDDGLVTAVAAGSATITVTTTDGSFTATCDVTVNGSTPTPSEDDIEVTIGISDYTAGYDASGTSGTINKTVESTNDLSISYAGVNTQSSGGSAYTYTMYYGGNGYIYNTTCPDGYYPSLVSVSFASNTGTSGKAGITFDDEVINAKQDVNGSVTKGGTCVLENDDEELLYWNFSTKTSNVQVQSITITYSPVSQPTPIEPTSGDATFVSSEQGYTSGSAVSSGVFSDENITVSFSKSTGSNAPAYYSDQSSVRCYSNNTITVSSTKQNLYSIIFTFGSGDGSNTISVSTGSYSSDDKTWTSASNTYVQSVTFTIGSKSGNNRRIFSLAVNYYNATLYATDFLSTVVCDGTGNNAPSTSNWSTMSTRAGYLFDQDKDALRTANLVENGTVIEQAMYRYNYIISKYGAATYNNFLTRTISSSNVNFSLFNEDSNMIYIIVIVSVISATSIGCLFLIKKKKTSK